MTHRTKVWVALGAVYIIWGSTYLAIAVVVETVPPLLGASTRFLAAGAIMAAVVVRRGGTMRVTKAQLGSCVLIGCLLPGANAVLFFAERDTPIGLASLIIASIPLWVVVLRLLLGERLPTTVLVGVGIGFAGVAILLQPGKGGVTAGLFLCLLSAVMWSVGTVAAPRLPMPEDSFAATGWEMLAGGLVMLPFALTRLGGTPPSVSAILGWLYLVTFGSVIGYTAYTWLLANAPLGLVSTYAYANPVVAILLGLLFRGESLTWRILIGALVVVAAVALVVRQDAPSATQREEGVR